MRVMLTGGAGFIGSHLVELLAERGDDVLVIDSLLRGNKIESSMKKRISLVVGDIRDYDVVERHARNRDIVYHLASVLGVDVVADNPVETMENEVMGLKNVVDASVLHGVGKVVYASTSGVYGKAAMEKAVTEEEISVAPCSCYSVAKRFCEIYLASSFEEKGLNSVSARLFNVYGPRQDTRMVIPRFFFQALKGEPITVYGSGKQTRDFTYVDDVATALSMLGDSVSGAEIFNVSNGTDVTIQALAEWILKITNSKSQIINREPPRNRYAFEVERRIANSEKLLSVVGYRCTTSLLEGLEMTSRYLLEHGSGETSR